MTGRNSRFCLSRMTGDNGDSGDSGDKSIMPRHFLSPIQKRQHGYRRRIGDTDICRRFAAVAIIQIATGDMHCVGIHSLSPLSPLSP